MAEKFVTQTVEHIQTVYAFNFEERAVRLFSSSKMGFVKGCTWEICVLVLFYGDLPLLYCLFVFVQRGQVSGGRALAAILSAVHSITILLDFAAFSKGREALDNITEMINKTESLSGEDIQLSEVRGDLELRNVAFNYSSSPNGAILRDLSLRVPAGRTVALVGARGCGKSTVVSLIERFYDPVKGHIFLDNIDIRTLHLGWLRNQVGMLNQEPLLFATSIFKNILHGKEGATMKEVEAAAKAANAHSFIMKLPEAYETQIGACRMELSDGQKQRLVIARTLLKDPKLLLLDEPTCGLSAASEEKVQTALERLMVKRSTLIIAHRLSTIQNVYAVNVLQDGCIVEMGTHNQLIGQNELGPYSSLVIMQEMALGGDGTVLGRTSIKAGSTAGVTICCCKNHLTKRGGSKPTRHQSRVDTDCMQEVIITDEDEVCVERSSERKTRNGSLSKLLKLSTPMWPSLCLGSMAAILGGALLNPSLGFIVGELLEVFYEKDMDKMERDIGHYMYAVLAVGTSAIALRIMQHRCFGNVAETLGVRVKETIFREALRNGVGWFDAAKYDGGRNLKKQLSTVDNNLLTLFRDGVAVLLKSTAGFITACIVGCVLEWQLTLAMLGIFLLLAGRSIGQELCSFEYAGLVNRSNAHSSGIIRDAVRNVRAINACNGKETIVSIFKEALIREPGKHPLLCCYYKFGIFFGLSEMIFYCSSGLILWYGSTLVKNGTSEFGSISKVFMVFFGGAVDVTNMMGSLRSTIDAFKSLHTTFTFTDRVPSVDTDHASSEVVQNVKGSVDFVDVEFAYSMRQDVTIFKGLNLNIKARQRIALVGAKGSGKSSLIALVERFYDPSKGRVMIDGKDIRGLNLSSLRQHIGLVQSDPVIFDASMSENILCGQQGATQDEVQRAAEAAEAHIFIQSLRAGYNAQVGNHRVRLNRGQQQRVAIARVALKNPAILLVDDATAGLDSQQRKVVRKAMDRLMVGRTTILVTRSLPDVCMVVDSICVLEGGRIIEQGSHGQLMEAHGSYARLWKLSLPQTELVNCPPHPFL